MILGPPYALYVMLFNMFRRLILPYERLGQTRARARVARARRESRWKVFPARRPILSALPGGANQRMRAALGPLPAASVGEHERALTSVVYPETSAVTAGSGRMGDLPSPLSRPGYRHGVV